MRQFRNAALCVAAAASLAAASDVTQLKKDTFDAFVKDHNLVLAEFFAPWCGHCKALAPEYEEAATTLKEKDIALAKIDCTEEADLCQQYGVSGYPTLKVFRGLDNHSPYGGQRKAPAIVSYMTKQALPAVSDVTAASLDEFKTADKVVLVAYYDSKDTKANETFKAVAEQFRDKFLFGATSDADLAKAEGTKQPSVVLYKTFDEGKSIFEGTFEKEAIEKFANMASVPLVGEVGPDTYADYMSAGIPLAYVFAEKADEREAFAKEFKDIAKKHKGKINVAVIDAEKFGQHAQNLNLEVGKWPAFAIQDTVKNQKFPLAADKKVDAKTVGAFVDDYLAGKVEPSVKSEPIPEKQEGPVTVVVAHNYQDVVIDNDKDVLLEFYAPWCGHCKSLAPKYEELATLFGSHAGKVTVAKVDATANDVPDEIQGFPTIKLFPAGGKDKPIEYSGSRSIEDLAKFIAENGKHKIAVDVEVEKPEDDEQDMPSQAPAASKVKDAAAKATDVVKEAVDSAIGGDAEEQMDDHDEL